MWDVVPARLNVDALRPASAEGDHPERRENRESQTETGVSRGDLPVDLLLADGASDVLVDLFELDRPTSPCTPRRR